MASSTAKPKPFVLHASTLARAHTYLAFTAFLSALLVGCALHYKKIVKNGVAGYPQEWFPSVSATRPWPLNLRAGPRFALVALQYYLHRTPTSSVPGFLFLIGILRTLSCGGWVFITSSDDHDVHDVLMISYIVLNLPWMFGSLAFTPVQHTASRRRRLWTSTTFFLSIVPMIYFFVQHKVHRIPGAYTHYSFFEWGLIFLDVLYDSSAELDFEAADLKITVGNLVGGSTDTDKIVDQSVVKAAPSATDANAASLVATGEKMLKPNGTEHPPAQSPSTALFMRIRPTVSFLSDLYLSYIYWSVYTSLAPTLFYFSVWELGIAGHELALLSTLSPVLLGIPPFALWAHTREGRTILHGLSAFVGLGAYASRSPLVRLLLVTFANAVAAVGAAVEWFGVEEGGVAYRALVTGLGFLVSSLSKHANHSNNPVWPIVNERSGGWNKTGIAFTIFALLEFASRPATAPSSSPPASPENAEVFPPSTHWLPASLALGGLIFSLHSLLSDPTTLIAWAWTGYPLSGPVPALHGSLTHLAQALGLALAAFVTSADGLAHPLYLALGTASAYVMYAYKDWAGYAGGLGVAVFLMSIIPTVWARAREAAVSEGGGVGRTAAVAWLVVCLFDVASTFTVAYAFVPGGEYFRERTDLVLVAQFVCIALAFRWPGLNANVSSLKLMLPKRVHYTTQYTLAILTTVSLLVTLYWAPKQVPQPHRPGSRIVRAGIWTVHFGIDNEGRDSQRLMRDLIRDMELDVVGLLETDLHRVVFGNRDLSRVMAEELGFYVDIGPGPNQHTWGAVLLSKFPIINSTHHLLPSPAGELAPAIEAYLDMFGTAVKVIVAHNGQEETPLDRELQSMELARIMSSSYPDPLIFLGYVVTKPHARRPAPYEIMVTDGKVHDIDEEDVDRWCEYIFYRGLYRTSYARVSRGIVTDTELQIGQFVVPKPGTSVSDDSRDARYMRSGRKRCQRTMSWFPMPYYPELGGKNGHQYHVFNTPLYYKLPQDAML
ncbi:Frag1/DRAM/Sfk1 family-domain-containing protein [Cerioporus squamosus]|nr:Frag1/DRAM/Sfk1 family-domain-containing protein [Cerioporus squamosus]